MEYVADTLSLAYREIARLNRPSDSTCKDLIKIVESQQKDVEALAVLRKRVKQCLTMDEAEKIAMLRALQEIMGMVGLIDKNSLEDVVEAVRELTSVGLFDGEY